METRRWINHSLPQTLHAATLLLYITAALSLLFGATLNPVLLAIAGATVAAGYGIANEFRWGYRLGIAMAFLPFVVRFLFLGIGGVLGFSVFSLMFEIILIVLLLHPQSRDHQRIWFS